MSDKKFYVTTPIYYVNARPHIGHAYTTIVADVLARRHRLLGDDTFFLTGTDEHGQKIERSAAAAGIAPQQFADQVSKSFQDLWHRMGITNNDYIRTTSDKHKLGVQHLFSELYKNGFIYLASYTGSYCVSDEAFVDAPVGTPCPDCGRLLEEVTEENFFFKLSAFQRPLLDLIESDTIAITPDSRKNEVLSFLRGNVSAASMLDAVILSEGRSENNAVILSEGRSENNAVILSEGRSENNAVILSEGRSPKSKDPDAATTATTANPFPTTNLGTPYNPGALKDLSISRSSFTWGIPVPEPAASAAAQKHVIYVWLDALANYMTAIGYGSDDPAEQAKFNKYWPADLHLVGKEIIRFHCVYWPAFLLALNPAFGTASDLSSRPAAESPLPQNLSSRPEAESPVPQNWSSRPEAEGRSGETCSSVPPQLTFDQHKAWAKKMLPQAITAHGWLLFEDSKMSKSKGNIVRTETILDAFGTLCPPPLLSFRSAAEESASPVPATDAVILSEASSENNPVILSEAVGGSSPTAQSKDPEALGPATTAQPFSPANPTPHDRDLFASDVLRYFLLREIPFGQDGSFSFDALITRYNADLANGYGNLVSRTLSLIAKFYENKVPTPRPKVLTSEQLQDEEEKLGPTFGVQSGCLMEISVISQLLDQFNFSRGLDEHAALVSVVDSYLTNMAPWNMSPWKHRTDISKETLEIYRAEILYTAAESIRIITALLYPILPYATARVWAQLGLGDIELAARNGELNNLQWGGLKPGTKLGPLGPIFPRADKGLAQIMTDMENPTTTPTTPAENLSSRPERSAVERPAGEAAPTPAPATPPAPLTTENGELTTPQITIDDFAKIELRVAQILVAERIPKADKLLRLEVDLGPHGQRQILSGIAEFYTPEELIGRRIVVITNLAPRKMRGLESHGMLLAASDPEAGDHGKPHLATCGDDIALGSRLK